MKLFKSILVTWQPNYGADRVVIGRIRGSMEKPEFRWLLRSKGSTVSDVPTIPGFPFKKGAGVTSGKSQSALLRFLEGRIVGRERNNRDQILDYWLIPPSSRGNVLEEIAFTQGKLPTDRFEFLAEFNAHKGLHFKSNIAGLKYSEFQVNQLEREQQLTWESEPSNPKDKDAIKLIDPRSGLHVGYVKRGHVSPFHSGKEIEVTVSDVFAVSTQVVVTIEIRVVN